MSLSEEVVRAKGKKHFNEVYQDKKSNHMAEPKIKYARRAIEVDRKNFQADRITRLRRKSTLFLPVIPH